MSEINDELLQFLRNPANLATAYDIRDLLAEVEVQVFQTFWSRVRDLLEQHVTGLGCETNWRVVMSASVLDKHSHLSISPNRATEEELRNWCMVSVESLCGQQGRSYLGVTTGRTQDEELVRELKAEKFTWNKYWHGYKYFHSLNLPDFLRSKENVMRLSRDNEAPDHSTAQAVAEKVADLFGRYQLRIQQLNPV